MQFDLFSEKKSVILALGAESAGNFSVFKKNKIYLSEDLGDLLEEKKWHNFQKATLDYLHKNQLRPNVILTDLHPLFLTTQWGQKLSRKYAARHIPIQHHHAHAFSAIGDKMINDSDFKLQTPSYAITCDGTGYGKDGKIWGGEVFKISKRKTRNTKLKIERIGHLEDQLLIGGDLAIHESARMLLGILNKFLNKNGVYGYVKKYYTRNEFELLYNQLRQNFNCQQTSSAGRVLDAVSLLLGFCDNARRYKHEPIDRLERNSTQPYRDLRSIIINPLENSKLIQNSKLKIQKSDSQFILQTTPLFEYLLKNKSRDKKRLAATAQLYLAEGLWEILTQSKIENRKSKIFFAGGIANNKIISSYLEKKGVYAAQKIPRGDAGLSFGQITYYLCSK